MPFDLSKVFFIATANSLESIPGPLLDRMEVIDLTGYTTAEKVHIAKNHLIPKQLKEHGLTAEQLVISEDTLMRLISGYTREAGVRELQRRIAAVMRGSSERVLKRLNSPSACKLMTWKKFWGPSDSRTKSPRRSILRGSSRVSPGLRWVETFYLLKPRPCQEKAS